jgi:NAD(P)H-hydrate epimerase
MKRVTQAEAIAIDETFFTKCSYTVDQLMELAGQSVAHVIFSNFREATRFLIVCGPGNNGGDGLVVARHLHFFGKDVTVFQPKPGKGALLEALRRQMDTLSIIVKEKYDSPIQMQADFSSFDVIVDAIFGHSFKPPVRPEFAEVLSGLKACGKPIVSIDIPSGWDVEKGDVTGDGICPAILISLSAPKLCSTFFKGAHYLGGRFVPEFVQKQFDLNTPPFPDTSLFVRLS